MKGDTKMDKTLEELFMEIFEDKNAEEKLKGASSIEEIYDCCCNKGYRKSITVFEMELKNLIYEINQTLNIPEDFLEKVAGGIKNPRFNKMTAGLLSLMSLGSITASPTKAAPVPNDPAVHGNKSSLTASLSKESLKKYASILGVPSTLITGGGLPLLLTLKKEIQPTAKANLKKTSQLIIDETKDLDKFNSLKPEAIAEIFNAILDEVYRYLNEEKPKEISTPKSNRDLIVAISQHLHNITSKLDKESSQYKKLERLKLAFIGLSHELFKNNQNTTSSFNQTAPAPLIPPPPPAPPLSISNVPAPPTFIVATPNSSTPKPLRKVTTTKNNQTENVDGPDFMQELKEKLRGGVKNILRDNKNSQPENNEKFTRLAKEREAKLRQQKEEQKQKINFILDKFPNLKRDWISERCNKLNEEIRAEIQNYSKIEKEKQLEYQKEVYNLLHEYQFLNNLNKARRSNVFSTYHDDNLEKIDIEMRNKKMILNLKDIPKDPYTHIDYKELAKILTEREQKAYRANK